MLLITLEVAMEPRQQRGMEIAATKRIAKKGALYVVPSQTHTGSYVVEAGEKPSCSCPDFELRGGRCKHIFAVEYASRRETLPDGTVIETQSLRVTYSQDWRAYNAAQTTEKAHVEKLLRDLCNGITQPVQKGRGRPRLPIRDVVFGCVMKVYSTVSGRRATTGIREAEGRGLMAVVPHYNTLFTYLENPALTPLPRAMIEESAAPLRAVEQDFAVDSSGFSTNTYARWYDEKYGRHRKQAEWIKAHLMCGVKTNVVTSVEITGKDVHDTTQFPALVETTAERFPLRDVTADKAYLSRDNLALVASKGGTAWIPFKSNSTNGSRLWQRMFHLFHLERPRFLAHYNKRSNVETTFSMIKRKFGGAVRSKTETAQINEVLCKVLCHNLAVLVHSWHELGIDPTFWAEEAAA